MKIMITGGAGYIGSHTYLGLVGAGHEPVIVDNFANSSPHVLDRLEQLTQRKPIFYEEDICNADAIEKILAREDCEAVIHFAGLKSVAEGQKKPLPYYQTNVGGTERLLNAMERVGCKKLIFSSSATVYGEPQYLPIDEGHPLTANNVYGRTKLVVEDLLRDLFEADPDWSIALMRYFNPVGADATGIIGEDPRGIPNNLMPYVTQVAIGRRQVLSVFGDDYATPDGTGVRDYIHVCDLAKGHVAALTLLEEAQCIPINLGTGNAYSVLEVVKAFEQASGIKIPYKIINRRSGDVSACFANPTRAAELMGWKAKHTLPEMCADTWRWQQNNPNGYETS